MTFLIDGYNLMYAVGLARQKLPARGLHRARERFLNWLADTSKGRPERMSVVFDSRTASRDAVSEHRGVQVRYSDGETADAVIEATIRAEPRPEQLGVVSNDNQVREAGRVRGCRVYRCEEFVDWLIAEPTPVADDPEAPEKVEPEATPEEMAAWLEIFSTPKKKRRQS